MSHEGLRAALANCERVLERALTQQGLSARAHHRILKMARTIALGDDPEARTQAHRTLDRT